MTTLSTFLYRRPALYVGLDEAPEAGTVVRLWLSFAGVRSGGAERARIESEAEESADACVPPGPLIAVDCGDGGSEAEGGASPGPGTGSGRGSSVSRS